MKTFVERHAAKIRGTPWTNTSIDHILGPPPGFTDADRAAMLGETAARLLKL